MAININGQVLRNVPEQVSKNVEDIKELQYQEQNLETRVTALEAGAIALATFQDCSFTGTTSFAGPLVSSDGFTFSGAGSVGGDLSVGGNLSVTGSTTLSGTVTASGNENVGGDLSVSGTCTASSFNGDNAKPLYWHSLTLYRITPGTPDVLAYYFDFIIVNNDPTPFTMTSFNDWLSNHQTAEIKIVQGYDLGDADGLVTYFKYYANQVIEVYIVDISTGVVTAYTRGLGPGVLTDNGVNKLN